MDAVQTIEALTTRRDRTDDDALANRVELLEGGSQFVDHTDRLVPQDEAWFHWILTADDVHVRSADRGGCDPDDRLACPRRRLRDLFDGDAILALEHDSFHGLHDGDFPSWMNGVLTTHHATGVP